MVWEKGGLWSLISPLLLSVEYFVELIFKICETWSSNNVKMLVMLMWSLWRRRNVKLWDSIEETSEAVQMRANVVIQDWKLAESFHQRY